jgi:hypothetical protein
MSKLLAVSCLIALILMISGCGKGEPNVIGVWKADTSTMPAILRDAMERNATRLEFKSDHTLVVSNMSGAGGSITWSLAGTTVNLVNSDKNALFFNDKDSLAVGGDGKLYLQLDGGGKPMPFMRE